MKYQVIEALFKTKDYTLTKLDKGVTNHNYLLCVKNEKYILRIPYDDHKELISHNYEGQVLPLVKNLDVPTIYFDEKTGIKISQYIEKLSEYKECEANDKIERCAILLKKLHTLPTIQNDFQPIKTLLQYKEKVSRPLFDVSTYEHIIEEVRNLKHQKVLCHNDIVSGNLLFGNNRDYLIDYEYASNNDALFDVMSFLSENSITDINERERFYNVYFDEITTEIRHDLSLWEMFHNLLWCYWAMMLYESRKEQIYKTIATDKFNALKKMKI